MVFEPAAAPRDRTAFLAWYEEQTRWAEEHSYNDPSVCSPALQRWFAEMIETFPPMNGPLASGKLDSAVTDHCCGHNVIVSAFAPSVAEAAAEAMRRLAIKHRVGFFGASDSPSELLFPAP